MLAFVLLASIFWLPCNAESKENSKETTPSLNEEEIKNHLDFLLSPKLKGRKSGTEGVKDVQNYIIKHFKNLEFNLDNKESETNHLYSKTHETRTPVLEDLATVEIVNEQGETIDKFRQYEDFRLRKDDFSLGGKFSGPLHQLKDRDELYAKQDDYADQGVIIDYQELATPENPEKEIDKHLTLHDVEAIIYREDNEISSRSIQLGFKHDRFYQERGAIKIGASKEMYQEIINYQEAGNEVRVSAPLLFEKSKLHNLLAFFPGESAYQEEVLMIAASVDGLGKDPRGEIHDSALNYAASVALALELARAHHEEGLQYDADLVFAFFDGTHLGETGIKEYLDNPLFPEERTRVIYLDELGAHPDYKLTTYQPPGARWFRAQNLVGEIETRADEDGFTMGKKTDDLSRGHVPFREKGIIAASLTSCHEPELSATNDLFEPVDTGQLKETGKLLLGALQDQGQKDLFSGVLEAVKDAFWIVLLLPPLAAGKVTQTPVLRFTRTYPVLFIWLLFFCFISILYYQTYFHLYNFTPLLYQEISPGAGELLSQFSRQMPSLLTMGFFFWMYLVPAIGVYAVLEIKFENINRLLLLGLVSTASYVSLFIPFLRMDLYDDYYRVLFPQLLDIKYGEFIIPLVLVLVSLGITLVLKTEVRGINSTMLALAFFLVLFGLLVWTLAPYMYSQELIELRSTGARILF